MRDLASHEKLQRVLASGVVAEIDEPLIDNFRAGLGSDIATQIDVELPGYLQIISGPGIP